MNAGLGTGHLSGTDYAFGSQVWNSFNESVGLTISIPIFSNRQYKTAYNKAKYAITTSQLELLNTQKAIAANRGGDLSGRYLVADPIYLGYRTLELRERKL